MARWLDGPMTRCPDGPMSRWIDGPTPRCPDGPTPRWPDAPTPRRPDASPPYLVIVTIKLATVIRIEVTEIASDCRLDTSRLAARVPLGST